VGIVFKGSGWYCTDSRSGSPATLPPKEKAEDKPEAKGEKAEKKEAPTAEKKDS